MNTFTKILSNQSSLTFTDNGAVARDTTQNYVYDLFALGAAYRNRSVEDCRTLFAKAYGQNPELALKCLFWLRDVRGGAGERRFFREILKYLAENNPTVINKNMDNIPFYGRWDDLFVLRSYPSVWKEVIKFIDKQLKVDMQCRTPSLLGKWMPSENTSSKVTKQVAHKVRKSLGLTSKEYRKMLTFLRKKINIVENLISHNKWSEIQYDRIPSRAGLIYRNAFARHDYERYNNFITNKDTKVNAGTLYPYDIVEKANQYITNDTERQAVNKFWENQKDYFNGNKSKIICVVDTSGSMWGRPEHIALGLGMYCAERLQGDFHNKMITFSSKPTYIELEKYGSDFVSRVQKIQATNICQNTNLEAVFDLLLETAKQSCPEDIPSTIVVLSDMQIDQATREINYCSHRWSDRKWTEDTAQTTMEKIKLRWKQAGIKCPKLVYWNCDAKNDTFLEKGEDVTFVSGSSPVLFEQIISGKTGYDICLETITAKRYDRVKF